MKKFVMAALGGTVAGALLASQVAPLLAEEASKPASVYQNLDLFGDIFQKIRRDYVGDVDDKKLIEAAINGMLTSLDPHSSYMPPTEYDNMQTQTRGSFGGLGIEVTQEDGVVKVVSPMDGTPAANAGIKPGDFITQVNGENLMGMQLDQAVEKMRGPVGSEITITVMRQGEKEPLKMTMTRDTIKMTAVRGRVEGKTVILRITTFNNQTFPNLQEAIAKGIKDVGGIDEVDGFVIDMRNNPGGLLNQAISVSDAFLDKGEIVSIRGRNKDEDESWNAEEGDLAQGKPIVVLINGGSASASEIVTGALQDHHRAIVVGTKSFGKGSVQTVIPIQDEGAMRLTTARYYTPSGRSIQALGIQPDIVVPQPEVTHDPNEDGEQRHITSEADLRGILSNDSMTDDEKKQAEAERVKAEEAAKLRMDDFQLAYAIDLLKGMQVIGTSTKPVPAMPTPQPKPVKN